MESLSKFQFDNQEIRYFLLEDDIPWFFLKDITVLLGLRDIPDIFYRLPDNHKKNYRFERDI
jgi:prophage antirepressor-like protein